MLSELPVIGQAHGTEKPVDTSSRVSPRNRLSQSLKGGSGYALTSHLTDRIHASQGAIYFHDPLTWRSWMGSEEVSGQRSEAMAWIEIQIRELR